MAKLVWEIGGPAGYGIKSTGTMLAKSATRSGLSAFGYIEYPSLIRGGHNVYQVVISDQEARSASDKADLLVCLDEKTFPLHEKQLNKGAGVVYDGSKIEIKAIRGDLKFYSVPLLDLAIESGGGQIHANMVALGVSLALMDLGLDQLDGLIEEEFSRKGEKTVLINQKAAQVGYKYINEKFAVKMAANLNISQNKKPKMYLTGNDAMSMGAIAAGCRYYSAYPMTPSSAILEYMEKKERQIGMVVKQMEDEIAVINSAIGASWAGARSFCATSGGGFSLMVEALGLSAMSETPLVIAEVQRSGPSTGMPTWGGQEDLRFVLNASQGEFPRIVIAPGDVKESYELTAEAFNSADIYQTPVILVSDKLLAESYHTSEKFSTSIEINRGKLLSKIPADYKRYQLSEDGVSPRVIPGTEGGTYLSNSYEHNEAGFSSDEPEDRVAQMDKRFKKLEKLKIDGIKVYGDKNADTCIIGWGSTKGVILDALDELAIKGKKVKFIQVILLSPFPSAEILKELGKCKKIYSIESNKTGQLADLIAEKIQILPKKILKYNGRPFFSEEIINKITNYK